ncbi:MAG TPA: hypothetical protein VE129_15845 [Thermoanaerobaculia bacterium]|nr:hypothetical protein [Thermoanaerobaculia bacterium]
MRAVSRRRRGEPRAAPETLAPEIAELETLETALKILAQESAALMAPGEVAARLDELVAGAEATGETVREIEELSRQGEASQRQRAALLQ